MCTPQDMANTTLFYPQCDKIQTISIVLHADLITKLSALFAPSFEEVSLCRKKMRFIHTHFVCFAKVFIQCPLIYVAKIKPMTLRKFLSSQAVQCLNAVCASISTAKELAKLVQGTTQQFHLIVICQNFITIIEHF